MLCPASAFSVAGLTTSGDRNSGVGDQDGAGKSCKSDKATTELDGIQCYTVRIRRTRHAACGETENFRLGTEQMTGDHLSNKIIRATRIVDDAWRELQPNIWVQRSLGAGPGAFCAGRLCGFRSRRTKRRTADVLKCSSRGRGRTCHKAPRSPMARISRVSRAARRSGKTITRTENPGTDQACLGLATVPGP
jgi:hypothetical protein